MSDTAIQVDNLWKKYRLGVLSTGTLRHDFNRWWHRMRGKEDPYTIVGQGQTGKIRSASLLGEEMWALQYVSFEVKRGEILGIIGRNGAGKSTLLKILSRVTAPSKGEVRVRGRIASLLEVGTGFHPELTGRENIFLNGAILGMTKVEIKRKLDEIIAFAEVEKFIDTPVKRYSSGMYVRLAFAVAAHLEPEILLVDEILAVGDIAFQKKCLGKMGDVAKEGRTVLFVSHNMAVTRQLCQRSVLLHDGTIIAEGVPAEVVRCYLTRIGMESSRNSSHCSISPAQHDPKLGGTSSMQLHSLRLLNNKFPTFTVHWKQPITFEMEIEAKEYIRNVYFGLGVKDNNGTEIFGSQSHERGQPMYDFAPGIHRIVVTIDNPLRAGHYNLSVGAANALGNAAFMQVDSAVTFEVLEVSLNGETHPQYRFGTVNGWSKWAPSERAAAVQSSADH